VLEWDGLIGLSPQVVPTVVPGLADVVGIAAAAEASVVITRDGRVFSWGAGTANGHGGTAALTVPTELVFPAAATAVVAGWQHFSLRLADGSLWGWGANQGGQLGDGTTVDRRTPVKASGVSLD
jgi:alpha-tubulin suppressor-like RCC1 family protein